MRHAWLVVPFVALSLGGVAQAATSAAPKEIRNPQRAIKRMAGEKWVDGAMRAAVNQVHGAAGRHVRQQGGYRAATITSSDFIFPSTTATLPSGIGITGSTDKERGGGVTYRFSAGVLHSVDTMATRTKRGLKNLTVTLDVPGQPEVVRGRMFIPGRRGTPARIASSTEQKTQERARALMPAVTVDLQDADARRVHDGLVGHARAVSKVAAPSARRALAKLVREVEAVMAQGPALTQRREDDLNEITATLPDGTTVKTSLVSFVGERVSIELTRGGVTRRADLSNDAITVDTSKPKQFAAGVGAAKTKLYASAPRIGEAFVTKTQISERPVRE